ncbi:MAG: phosphotransferase [Actinomycetes bacterium]
MTAPAVAPVAEFGTGLLHTTITADGEGGFVWSRRPGPLAPAPFAPADPELAGRIAAVELPAGVRLVPGAARGEAREYRVAGARSVADHLIRDGVHPCLEPALRGLGAALAALHALPPPAHRPAAPSRGLARLEAWLRGRPLQAWAAQAAAVLRDRIGPDRWARLCAWAARTAGEPAAGPVLCHGAPGLGSVVFDPHTGVAEILVGEDLCVAPRHADLGWVIGELVELSWRLGGDVRAWQGLTDALLEGYGHGTELPWNHLAAVRIALHLHDYTAYVAWDPAECERYAHFLGYLIDL